MHSVICSSDNHTLAVANANGIIDIWDIDCLLVADEITPRLTLDGFYDYAEGIAFSSDDKVLAAALPNARGEGRIHLWDIESGELRSSIATPGDRIRELALIPSTQTWVGGGRASDAPASRYHPLVRIGLAGLEVESIGNVDWPVEDIAVDPLGLYVATAMSQAVEIWSWDNGQLHKRVDAFPSSVAWLPDERVVVGNTDGTVSIWDWQDERIERIETGYTKIEDVAVNPSGTRLAAVGQENVLTIWDTTSLKPVVKHDFDAPSTASDCVRFHPMAELVAVCLSYSNHTVVAFIDSSTGDELFRLYGAPWAGFPTDVAFNAAGTQLAISGSDGIIRLFGVPAG